MSNLPAKEVKSDNLLHEVALLKQQGFRLITLTCLDTGEGHDVIFHFDKHYQMSNLRLPLGVGQALVSITSLYPAAMVVENEIKDHFGLRVEGLSLDFQGRLVLTEDAPRAPMSKRCGMDIDARVPRATTTTGVADPRGGA
jgi:ech hydrogenase subunit D